MEAGSSAGGPPQRVSRPAVTAVRPALLGCERAVRLRPEHGPADGENVRTVGRAIARRAVVARGKAADDMSAVTRGSDRSVQGSPAPSRGPTGRDDVSILESLLRPAARSRSATGSARTTTILAFGAIACAHS